MRKVVEKSRVFEYSLMGLIVLVLVGFFGRSVLGLNQQLAGAKLTSAFHAMQISMLLAHTHCLLKPELHCSAEYADSFLVFDAGLHIQMQKGYPAASADGIILAAGLQDGVYSVQYMPEGLFLYVIDQLGNAGCRVRYTLPFKETLEATITLDARSC